MAIKEIIEHSNGFPLFSDPISDLNIGDGKKIIISDIWAFWYYIIKKFKKVKKKNNSFESELISYLEQAKYFYESAESSPIKSKPLLYYYSFLNLSKIIYILKVKPSSLHNISYTHGISEVYARDFKDCKVSIKTSSQGAVQVAHQLFMLLDETAPNKDSGPHNYSIKELLNHCVGIHRAYCEIYSKPESFIKIKRYNLFRKAQNVYFRMYLGKLSDDEQKDLLLNGYQLFKFYNNKTYDLQISNDTIDCIENNYHKDFNIDEEGYYSYLDVNVDHYSNLNKKNYSDICKSIRKKGIWYFIGNNGYTLYLSRNADLRYSQESIIYMTMFFLGSITRYNPYLFDSMFSEKEQWLMSEFLSTQPKQFLYLITAKVLGRNILKAYSSF
ncbi:hypothetical protein AM202_05147 [Actinobacillus minor 202]|uniref:Uncharacterized protein n=1 Tax=Actinobacillus minor 202 TaxID=591023 RepID=A0ABP2GR03_9PAST|nr:YaaC family protein [Actinobacillus minor]EEV24317.1 hypothetical protein AM202_05147 [Actinobacillus minor 202]